MLHTVACIPHSVLEETVLNRAFLLLFCIVNVEEAVASIPGDILDPPSDLTRAPAATAASPESVREDASTPESLETAESSVVSLCQVLQLSHHSLLH